jgi:hypothetical protein
LEQSADLDFQDGHSPLLLVQEDLDALKIKAMRLLHKVGYEGMRVNLYVVAGCG